MSRSHRCLVVALSVIAGLSLAACGRGRATAGPLATIPLGAFPLSAPSGIALNPVTNRIYVAQGNAHVTVIDGGTNATTRVATGGMPERLVVNTVRNKVYVIDGPHLEPIRPGQPGTVIQESRDITVIDGATNTTSTVHVGSDIRNLVVNTATGKAYVTGSGPQLTVIDGSTDATSTVTAGLSYWAPVVNPTSNKVYLNTVAGVVVVDGATNATATVHDLGRGALAVDPTANRLYVVDGGSLRVVDGATNATIGRVDVGDGDFGGIAVNARAHKVYILRPNYPNPGSVIVVDGKTFAATTVPVGRSPGVLSVDETANALYVLDLDSDDVVQIDGATNAARATGVPRLLPLLAVNQTTGRVYVGAGGPKAGPVSGATPTNVPPPPYVLYVFHFKAGVPSVPIDTCQPSPRPGASVARGNC